MQDLWILSGCVLTLIHKSFHTKHALKVKRQIHVTCWVVIFGFKICYRHFYPDKKAAYTFWTYMMNCRAKNVGWRLDYYLVSKRLVSKYVCCIFQTVDPVQFLKLFEINWFLFFKNVFLVFRLADSVIRDSVYGSDHCPITLLLEKPSESD